MPCVEKMPSLQGYSRYIFGSQLLLCSMELVGYSTWYVYFTLRFNLLMNLSHIQVSFIHLNIHSFLSIRPIYSAYPCTLFPHPLYFALSYILLYILYYLHSYKWVTFCADSVISFAEPWCGLFHLTVTSVCQ